MKNYLMTLLICKWPGGWLKFVSFRLFYHVILSYTLYCTAVLYSKSVKVYVLIFVGVVYILIFVGVEYILIFVGVVQVLRYQQLKSQIDAKPVFFFFRFSFDFYMMLSRPNSRLSSSAGLNLLYKGSLNL